MNKEDNLCWFHGKLSRDGAEQILREEGLGDGVFLVRDSNTSGGDYVLSVLHKGEIWHYQIRRHGEDAFFSIDDQTPIHGLDSLIEHYQEASHGLVTQLSAIVKRDPPPHDSRSHGRTNLLHRATKEGDFTVVSELLKCGYRNIDAKNQDGQTAVHLACRFGNERMIMKLIESGANVNCRDTDGNTPLHYACRHQPATVIRLLADAKANIQARNNSTGCVPLHEAARHGNIEAVNELLQLGAPHMPRSSYGELPSDYAKDGNHTDVMAFFDDFKPSMASVYKYQWYHGTLDRSESNQILKQFAKNLVERETENQPSTSDAKESLSGDGVTNASEAINLTSGIFLVRYSEKTNDYVLTLLFENQPKHFIIQKFHKYLYIDEGPYMPSLEHLIEHYMRISDGLPINLRHPVPPKPKPPLPLFSTIPKKKRSYHVASDRFDALRKSTVDDITITSSNHIKSMPIRNMSIPTDDLMNTVGIIDPAQDSNRKSKDRNNDLLNFRSLKLRSPKRNIIVDGMKSLRKNKTKNAQNKKDKIDKHQSDADVISQSLKNLSFTGDFKAASVSTTITTAAATTTTTDNSSTANIDPATLYNVPPNNSPVKLTMPSSNRDDIQNQNVPQSTDQIDDYFTRSDSSQDKSVEEIYFVDAPSILKNDAPSTSLQYIAFKNVPYFPDSHLFDNNNQPPVGPRLDHRIERMDSQLSSASRDSEMFQRQSYGDSSPGIVAKPNYFIPKSYLTLNDVLGEGEFGSVYRGVFKCYADTVPDESSVAVDEIPVAIKTLHDEHCKQNRTEFLREASVMIKLSHHCIVRLIGISKGPPLMMVQELVPLGSMLNFLLTNADQINANFELKIWASQIACGMNFLEAHHFVHRDLAARNILLASKHQAKISDFGLSRALCTGNDYYQASQGGKWPIKWYAPESFNYGTFSHASDVWSFGVTLWEMFSYGLAPYGDMKGVDVIKLVEMGKRLARPALCPDNVFQIMESCWNYNPKDRPTFSHLTQFFANDPDYQNLVELINTEHIS